MKIGLINPNTTVAMTQDMVRSAQGVAAAETTILGLTPRKGPAALESFCDEVYAAPQVLDLIVANPGLDGYVIACSNDPGLFAARELLRAPVAGIGEAGYLFASTLARQFAVVTTLDRVCGPGVGSTREVRIERSLLFGAGLFGSSARHDDGDGGVSDERS